MTLCTKCIILWVEINDNNGDTMEIRYLTRTKAARVGHSFTANDGRTFTRAPEHDKESGACIAYRGEKAIYAPVQRLTDDEVFALQGELATRPLLRALGAVEEGESSTTVSVYGRLEDGRRVRVSDHPVWTTRSESDISVDLDFERETVRVNGIPVVSMRADLTREEVVRGILDHLKEEED